MTDNMTEDEPVRSSAASFGMAGIQPQSVMTSAGYEGVVLPETGGHGPVYYLAAGAALMIAGICGMISGWNERRWR